MTEAKLLRMVNTILFISFAVQAVTAAIILFRLKTPFTHMVFEVHENNGMVLIALAITHITLNWGWVRANFFGR